MLWFLEDGRTRAAVRIGSTVVGALLAATGNLAHAQLPAPAVIVGSVRDSLHRAGISYAVITIPSLHREEFTSDRGTFALPDLPSGPLTLRFRHIGFAPRDTTVQLRMGDTLRLDVTLEQLTIRLDAMHVVGSKRLRLAAGCPAPGDAAESAALIDLLEQVVQNAQQYRLLVKSHPFAQRFSRVTVVRKLDGSVSMNPKTMPGPDATDHFAIVASAKPVYQPGRVFRTTRGVDEVFVPELQDFADSVFIAKHCFSYGGDTTIDSARFIRVAFSPVGELTDPDIEGTVTLRADGYGLAAVAMRTTAVPSRFARNTASVRIETRFRDVLPGVAVLSRLESFLAAGPEVLKKEPGVASKGEIQILLGISWLKGPP